MSEKFWSRTKNIKHTNNYSTFSFLYNHYLKFQWHGMLKTLLSILIYHQHDHIGYTTHLLFYSAKYNGFVQSVVTSYNYSLIKMFCHNENTLSSELYSAKNHFSILKNILGMIYFYVYIWNLICCKMYVRTKKVKSLNSLLFSDIWLRHSLIQGRRLLTRNIPVSVSTCVGLPNMNVTSRHWLYQDEYLQRPCTQFRLLFKVQSDSKSTRVGQFIFP